MKTKKIALFTLQIPAKSCKIRNPGATRLKRITTEWRELAKTKPKRRKRNISRTPIGHLPIPKATLGELRRNCWTRTGVQAALIQAQPSEELPGLGLQKARLANNLSAGRAVGDYEKNLAWQRYLAGSPLDAAHTEGGVYGTSTTGQDASLHEERREFGEL